MVDKKTSEEKRHQKTGKKWQEIYNVKTGEMLSSFEELE